MLRVTDLSAGYRSGAVARVADFAIQDGEAALLLGPSGSGKSTLLLAIAGLAQIHSGAIALDEVSVTDLPLHARDRFRGREIGLVFQDLHLIAGLSALDNVVLAPFAIGGPQQRDRALSLLEGLGISELAHRPAQKLSRGQAQRVAIARAMLLRPRLILADEPTSSLDDEACESTCALLLRAASETGAALVIATHDARLKTRVPLQLAVERMT